jgi:hypothetical protein
VALPLRAFFESPTIADLALVIRQEQLEQVDSEALAAILAELEQFSEADVQTILATQRKEGSHE